MTGAPRPSSILRCTLPLVDRRFFRATEISYRDLTFQGTLIGFRSAGSHMRPCRHWRPSLGWLDRRRASGLRGRRENAPSLVGPRAEAP